MTKKLFKEIIISLLLCLAIILLLGILLYDYVPMTKTLPNPVSYTTPDAIKQELASGDTVDESQIIMTYEVDNTDLNNYKTIQNYKPGKANPFSSYDTTQNAGKNTTPAEGSSTSTNSTSNEENGNNTVNTTNSTITPQTNETTGTTTTSGGQFFQDKGTK